MPTPIYLETRLDVAERMVADGKKRVARQRALVDRLEINGHETAAAIELLHSLRDTLAIFEYAWQRLTPSIER